MILHFNSISSISLNLYIYASEFYLTKSPAKNLDFAINKFLFIEMFQDSICSFAS
jgi:hypothetical protein